MLFRQTNPISRNRFVITGLEGVLGIGRFRRGAAGVAEFGDLLLRGLQHGDQGCVFLRGLCSPFVVGYGGVLPWPVYGLDLGGFEEFVGFHGWLVP